MSDLKKHLTDGTIAMPVQPEPLIDMGKLVFARYGREYIVTHVTVEAAARQIAGEFFELCRTNRFRGIWGLKDRDQDTFIDRNWCQFAAAAKHQIKKLLCDPSTPEHIRDDLHKAWCQEHAVGQIIGFESGSLQVEKDSEHFAGDKALNRDVDKVDS